MDTGAHFHACDFQVHTPRDRQWVGAGAVTPTEREEFASELVGACRARGLNGIAITDHHEMVMVPYIRAAAAAEVDTTGSPLSPQDKLVVFPGMELTLGVPCQALLLFDADFEEGFFQPGSSAEAAAIRKASGSIDRQTLFE